MSYTNPSDYQGLTGLIGQSFYQLRLAGFIRIFISVYTVTEDCEDFVRVAVVTDGFVLGWVGLMLLVTDGVTGGINGGNGNIIVKRVILGV